MLRMLRTRKRIKIKIQREDNQQFPTKLSSSLNETSFPKIIQQQAKKLAEWLEFVGRKEGRKLELGVLNFE